VLCPMIDTYQGQSLAALNVLQQLAFISVPVPLLALYERRSCGGNHLEYKTDGDQSIPRRFLRSSPIAQAIVLLLPH